MLACVACYGSSERQHQLSRCHIIMLHTASHHATNLHQHLHATDAEHAIASYLHHHIILLPIISLNKFYILSVAFFFWVAPNGCSFSWHHLKQVSGNLSRKEMAKWKGLSLMSLFPVSSIILEKGINHDIRLIRTDCPAEQMQQSLLTATGLPG